MSIHLSFYLLTAVNNYILRLDAFLQLAHFGVFPSTSKQPWRLQTKIAYFLLMSIQQTESILLG